MDHNHEGHNHSVSSLDNINRAFYIGIGLNALFTAIEFIVGYSINSLALISDASHNFSDVISLIISLIGIVLAKKASSFLYTYGYKKASILASLVNSILLIFIVIKIFIEAFERISSPPQISGGMIIVTALIGVIINTVSAFLFFKGQKDDINIRGAFLHLMVDALVSVGVVISGIIVYYTNWNIIDPIISFVIAIVILFSTWGLLKESVKLTLDGVPSNIDMKNIENLFLKNKFIKEIHHLHVWALSSSQSALTVHVVLKDNIAFENFLIIKKEIKHDLKHENIQHSTIELDIEGEECDDKHCD